MSRIRLGSRAKTLALLFLGAGLAIPGGACWMAWGHAQTAPAEGSLLRLTESRIYTLEEITRLLRERARAEIYVDRRQEERRIFVSQGIYKAPAIIEALSVATGMMARRVKGAIFLAPRDLTVGGRYYFPVLPQEDLKSLSKSLSFLAVDAPLVENQAPFTAADFLAQKTRTWAQLSPTQQTFVAEATGNVRRNARIRLGTSYLMCSVAYIPSASSGENNAVMFGVTNQVYYDYRNSLLSGIMVPAR